MFSKFLFGLNVDSQTCTETYTNGIWKGVCKDGSFNGIGVVLANVINLLTTLTIIVTVFFIMYGGFQYITSSGNEKGVEKAKQTITYALIGLIVALVGRMLVSLVVGRLTTQ